MKDNYDFDKIGRRMPYKAPAGYLDNLEANVLSRLNMPEKPARLITSDKSARRRPRMSFRRMIIPVSGVLAAASVAAIIFFRTEEQPVKPVAPKFEPVKIEQVDKAFYNLDDADREYLLTVYQNDVFMDDQTYITE